MYILNSQRKEYLQKDMFLELSSIALVYFLLFLFLKAKP